MVEGRLYGAQPGTIDLSYTPCPIISRKDTSNLQLPITGRMEGPRTTNPGTTPQSPEQSAASPWSDSMRLPPGNVSRALFRPDADTCVELSLADTRAVMNRLSVLSAQLKGGEIVLPSSVSHSSIESLVLEWRHKANVLVGRNTQGELIVKSNPQNTDYQSHFALLNPAKLPLVAGLLTDRGIEEHWPTMWRNYDDCKGKRVLDHCCGGGARVAALQEQGIDAHGVDIAIFGVPNQPFLHYGRAEKLPFIDGSFDRVESRMGILLWGQDNKQMCRETLSEMIRVTADGGTIRISPVRDTLLKELLSERTDVTLVETDTGMWGAFELLVNRSPQQHA